MGQMMFTDSKAWNEEYNGPAMMVPAWFAMLTLLAAAGVLMLWVAMDWWHRRNAQYTSLPLTAKAGAADEEAPHDSAQFADFALEDSANETSDGAHHAMQPICSPSVPDRVKIGASPCPSSPDLTHSSLVLQTAQRPALTTDSPSPRPRDSSWRWR